MRTELKVLRVKHGFTQKQVADLLGISLVSYCNLERGKTFGSNRTWEKIKNLYKLSDKDMWKIQH